MWNKFKSQFAVNSDKKNFRINAIIFDFVIVAAVSLSINGFIVNNNSSAFDQKYLIVFGAMMLSTQWSSQNLFMQKYEKDRNIFIVINFLISLSIAILATGMSLMVFRLNYNDSAKHFLRWFGPFLYLCGYASSRLVSLFQYSMALIANRKVKHEFKLLLPKVISRLIVIILASIHLTLLFITKDVAINTFIFFPLYFIVEIIGNNLMVTNKRIKTYAYAVTYVKKRYMRLTTIFISSIFISQIIQKTYYLQSAADAKIIWNFIAVFTIFFIILTFYTKIAYSSKPKIGALNIRLMSWISSITVASLSVAGGFLINSESNNESIIIPSVFFALFVLIIAITSLYFITDIKNFSSKLEKVVISNVLISLIFLIMGIVSLFFTFNINVLYGTTIGLLLMLTIFDNFFLKKEKITSIE